MALLLRLTPMAAISGHVLDESGEPVRSAQVRLFLEDHSGGMSQLNTLGGASSDDRIFRYWRAAAGNILCGKREAVVCGASGERRRLS
jgi:hypothetical protein